MAQLNEEMLRCARCNFENVEKMDPRVKQNPIWIIAMSQLRDGLGEKPLQASLDEALAIALKEKDTNAQVANKEGMESCPFCGCQQLIVCRTNPNACWVRCDNCGAESGSKKKRKAALTRWNSRSSPFDAVIIADDDKDTEERVQ